MESYGAKMVTVGGKKVSNKHAIAAQVWQAAATGEVTLPNGEVLKFDPMDWFGVVKWIYQHIDGPPKQELDMTSGGEAINIILDRGDA